MPLYEYRCRSCERRSEFLQRIDAPPKRKCPECGGRLDKLVSRSGFVFKGTGWYVTDYKSGGSADRAAGDSAPSTADETPKSEGKKKKDAKPADKALATTSKED